MSEHMGVYPAQVVNVKDPEQRGRVRVKCPEVLEDEVSAWCEPGYSYAVDFGGDFCIPSINEWVWVTFQEGDLDSPVYLGGWWQEKKTPLGSNYNELVNKVRIINYHNMNIAFNKTDNSVVINTFDPDSNSETEVKVTPNKFTVGVTVIRGGADFTIEDGLIKIDGNMTIKGDITVKGNIKVEDGGIESDGTIKAKADIMSDKVSLNNHEHTQTDTGITTKPN